MSRSRRRECIRCGRGTLHLSPFIGNSVAGVPCCETCLNVAEPASVISGIYDADMDNGDQRRWVIALMLAVVADRAEMDAYRRKRKKKDRRRKSPRPPPPKIGLMDYVAEAFPDDQFIAMVQRKLRGVHRMCSSAKTLGSLQGFDDEVVDMHADDDYWGRILDSKAKERERMKQKTALGL